jgi:hypothetical protein
MGIILLASWLFVQAAVALGEQATPTPKPPAGPPKPAAVAPAPAPVPVAPPTPLPPEKMDPKALTYPRAVIQQEIEVGKDAVIPLLTQFLARSSASAAMSAASPGSEPKPTAPVLDSEAVKKAMSSITRFLVVSMVPGPEAGGALDGENAAAHYGSLFSQFNWTSVLRLVEPRGTSTSTVLSVSSPSAPGGTSVKVVELQGNKSFHLMLAPDGKGLFFVTADPTRIIATLAISDAPLNPLLEVLAPVFGAGLMPSGLPSLSSSAPASPPKP